VFFNAVAMFTNIPVKLALGCIENRWNDIEQYTALPKEVFLEALTLCLENSYLCYNGKFHSQIAGLGMGSPLSCVVSEIVLDKLLIQIIDKFKDDVKFMTKYVDDTLHIIKKNIFDELYNFLKSFDSRILFTFETNSDFMNFLDVISIPNYDNSIIFRHYITGWSTKFLEKR